MGYRLGAGSDRAGAPGRRGAGIVRIPVGSFAIASRALDFGAEGIIAPMINTAEDARAYVSFASSRRSASAAGARTGLPRSPRCRTRKPICARPTILTVTFAMIDAHRSRHVEAIAATPIDALFLGPADLSIALSNGADVDPMSREVDRELDRIIAAASKAGKVMGAYCHSAERAVALAKRGVRSRSAATWASCVPARPQRSSCSRDSE